MDRENLSSFECPYSTLNPETSSLSNIKQISDKAMTLITQPKECQYQAAASNPK